MFTGLVETTGVLAERSDRGPNTRLVVRASLGGEPLSMGESIAVDGTCLSVIEIQADSFAADVTGETLSRTTLGGAAVGQRLNLERALRAGDRLGGHIVTGHVDAVAEVKARAAVGDAEAVTFSLPASLTRLVAEKGSIAVNGVSLTVNAVRAGEFDVMLIPVTLRITSLGGLRPGHRVNLEADLFARYVAAWMQAGAHVPPPEPTAPPPPPAQAGRS